MMPTVMAMRVSRSFSQTSYGRIVLGSLVLLSMTAAYVAIRAPGVVVETQRAAFAVPWRLGPPSVVLTVPICRISYGWRSYDPVASVAPVSDFSVRSTCAGWSVAFAMTAFVRKAASSRRPTRARGAASVTKSAAPKAGTDWPNVPFPSGGGVDVWLTTFTFAVVGVTRIEP